MTEPDARPWGARFALSTRGLFVVAAFVAAVALVVLWFGTRSAQSASVTTITDPPSSSTTDSRAILSTGTAASTATPALVAVHVLGAVLHPGVYEVNAGSRVAAAIDRAGGATEDADTGRLNLARVLVDGERVYVPAHGEGAVPQPLAADTGGAGGDGAGGDGASAATTGAAPVLDINAADATAFQSLPGIGPALAARIVAWRAEHGRFSVVEDLMEVSGIGEAKFASLRERVRV